MEIGEIIPAENPIQKHNQPAKGRRFSSLIAAEERFARRNVCDSTTEIPYWWCKICPESGQKS